MWNEGVRSRKVRFGVRMQLRWKGCAAHCHLPPKCSVLKKIQCSW